MDIRIDVFSDGVTGFKHIGELCKLLEASHKNNSSPHIYQQDSLFFDNNLRSKAVNVIAFSGANLVGYAVLRKMQPWPPYLSEFLDTEKHDPDKCALMLYNLVAPDARGFGIGKLLANKRIDIAKEKGFEHLYATVHPDNHASVVLLEKSGFRKVAQKTLFTEQLLRNVMYLSL